MAMKLRDSLFMSGATMLLSACSTVPLSYLTSVRPSMLTPEIEPVLITSVDGTSRLSQPVAVDAGKHRIVFEAIPIGITQKTTQKTIEAYVDVCTIYTFAAKRIDKQSVDWDLVLIEKTRSPGCKPSPGNSSQ